MLILLSPAKNMNFDPAPNGLRATKPQFIADTAELSETTKSLTRGKIKSLMKLSEKLADLNYERFQAFAGRGGKPAAFAFNGDVYLGFDARTLSAEDLKFAQDHVRILSGLYGLLRPLDAIEPYRLEMGSRLKNTRGANLYAFWGDKLAAAADKAVKTHSDKTIINLASNEYFSAVDPQALRSRVVTPVFKEEKDGALRQLQFFAKRARGAMARWATQNRVTKAEDLKRFNVDGYTFREGDSSDDLWLFTRPQPAPAKR